MANVTMPNGDVVAFPDDMPKANIRALIEKKFPDAARQAQADTGVKPYDNAGQTSLKALQGTPGNIMTGVSGMKQMAQEGEAGSPNRIYDMLGPSFDAATALGPKGDLGLGGGNVYNWAVARLGGNPTQAQITELGRRAGANEDFARWVKESVGKDWNDPTKFLGTDPQQVAKAELAGKLERQQYDKTIPQIDAKPGSMEEIVGNAVGSIAQMAPGYAASLITRNPLPTVALAQTLTSGQAYADARDKGMEPGKAAEYAIANGFAEAAGEALPLGAILKEGGKLIPRLFKAGVSEATQEAVTQLIQSGLESGSLSPDMTWDDVKRQVIAAAATGALAGVSLGTLAGGKAHDGSPSAEEVSAEVLKPAEPAVEAAAAAPVEDQIALPAPQTMLALPSPESFAPPNIARRQPPAPPGIADAIDPLAVENDYQARIALQRTRQKETAALLQTARETVSPLGTFSKDEIGGPAAQRVMARRVQTGRPVDAPITIAEMANAKVPQAQIDAAIAARKPNTMGEVLSPLDVARTAKARNIITTDDNFRELAHRVTGARDITRMTQTQLGALNSVIDAMPAHETPVTVPVADENPFTESQYTKALEALRTQGRYTAQAIKDATGLKQNKDVNALRDALVRRGQLVQRSPSDFRLYDVLGAERQSVPDDLPPGAFTEHTVRRIPVAKVRITQDGKSQGTFGSGTEARGKIAELRAAPDGLTRKIAMEPAEDVAYGVMENRYDEQGNLIGQVVVDTHRDETAARTAAEKLNSPDTGARYTQTEVTKPIAEAAAPLRKPPTPAVLRGRQAEIVKRLNKVAAERRLPLLGTRVNLVDKLAIPEGADVEGLFDKNVISLAVSHLDPSMTDSELVDRLAQVMDHETIHALRRAGVLAPETEAWTAITRYAKRAKRAGSNETYMDFARRNYSGLTGYEQPSDIEEEAVAEAFRAWASDRRNVSGKPGTVFRQLVEWFRRLLNAMPEDWFKAIESGSLVEAALRPPGANMPRAEATAAMQEARQGVAAAQAAQDENAVRVKSREFLRARAQAREDRYGRSGPKTVIGTTPTSAYASGEVADRDAVQAIVERFKTENGVSASRLMTLLPEPIDYLKRVADAQQGAVHAPKANDVAKSYRALIDETKAMWRALGNMEVTPWTADGQPYASPAEMLADVAEGRLKMRLSDDMFGPGADNPGHPMNAPSGVKATDGRELTNNDLFRVVHDVYGHGQSGFRDDPRGAYNAYHEHARLVSPEARRALATETLAQRAWQDYGPHLRRRDGTVPRETDIDYLPPNMKEFAQQKAFVLDDEALGADPGWPLAEAASAAEDQAPRYMVGWHGTPHKVDKFSKEKIGTGEGAQVFGYGLYFAGKKEIAEHYRNALTPKQMVRQFRDALPDDADFADVMELVGTGHFTPQQDRVLRALEADDWLGFDYPAQAISAAYSKNIDNWDPSPELRDAVNASGNLYKVDIPEDNELLDWDKPLGEQPAFDKKLRDKIAELAMQASGSMDAQTRNAAKTTMLAARNPDLTGEGAYFRLSHLLRRVAPEGPPDWTTAGTASDSSDFRGDRAASQTLHDLGIPGHRYLDGNSRFKPASIAGMKRDLAAWESRLAQTPEDTYVKEEVEARRKELADAEAGIAHNYVIYDDSRIQILEENPKFSRFDENLPGGRLYGNPKRSPGGALSNPKTPSPAFTNARPANAYFGGELAEHQLQLARTGERGAAMIYMRPADFLEVSGGEANPEQAVYDAAIAEGYKFSGLPSLVLDGHAGNVRAVNSDGAFAARALADHDAIPVLLYPKRQAEGLGLITAIDGAGERVAFPKEGFQEFDPSLRGPRYSVGSPEFRKWFGASKVVDEQGRPLVVYHGTGAVFDAFDRAKQGTSFDYDALNVPEDGFWFANDAARSSWYAGVSAKRHDGSANVMPVYLSMQKPFVYSAEDYANEGLASLPSLYELEGEGYDGVIVERGEYGEGDAWATVQPVTQRDYAVFSPTQIKSAIANKGTYDAANPDIRYSLNAPFGTRVNNEQPDDEALTEPGFNIVQQRVDGWVGKAVNAIGRSKRHIPGVGSIFDARVKLQDKMLSIKEMIEQIKEAGGDVNDLNDSYMLEQLYHGKVFEQIREREQSLQVPLLDALRAANDGPFKVTPKDFEDYLYARHAPERNAYLRARGAKDPNPSGMSDREASVLLDGFALDGKQPVLEDLARMADAITADTTRTRVEYGLISQQAADSSPYQYYIPLRGFAEEDLDPGNPSENQTRARSGRGFSVGGREDRTVTGRGRKAGDLLGHLFLQNTEAVIRGEKNDVALSFMRLLQQNEALGFGSILSTAPTRRVVGPNGMIHEAGDPSYRQQPDIVTAKWKGKEVIARVADPRLARAIKSDYVTTSNDLVNGLVNIAGKLNRYLATVNTSLNPEFLISNLARDLQTAGILSQQYGIKDFGRKVIGNAPKAMGGIREVLRGGTANSEWAQTFLEMQEAGGTTEFLGIHDLETQIARIRRSITTNGLSTTPRKAFEYIGKVFNFVDDYNKIAENAFRLSAFKAAREAGVSTPQAAYLAKNLTVNFNKGGELKTFMNAMYLFYNASTQGTAVLMNGLKNKRVQKIVAGVVVAGVLQDLLNRAISGDDDDNGVPDYDDIPDYVLQTNFVMMDPLGILKHLGVDKGYISIPMPYGFNAFYNLGRNLSAGFSGSPVRSPGKSAVDSMMGFMDAFNPLGGVQSIWNFIAPTFADPIVDLITNKDYAGNSIVPDRPNFGPVPVPESQKYWSNTGAIPVDTAAWINSATGGNEVRKGAVDISPETMQYVFDYATGATGKFVQRVGKLVTDTGPKALQGDFADIQIGDIPFARRVVGSIGSRGNTERYYAVAQEVATVKAELKMFEDNRDMAGARAWAASHPTEVRLIDAFDDGQKALQDLRKQLRDVRADDNVAPARKREIELAVKAKQDELMTRLNKLYFSMKSAPTR
jgi:hypothetical protein